MVNGWRGRIMVKIDKSGAPDDSSFSPGQRFDKTFCKYGFSCAQVAIQENGLAGP